MYIIALKRLPNTILTQDPPASASACTNIPLQAQPLARTCPCKRKRLHKPSPASASASVMLGQVGRTYYLHNLIYNSYK